MPFETLIASVLMVGHSLFGPDNPVMLQGLLRHGTPSATVEAQIINGAPLSYNWDHGANAEGVNARERLKSPVDAVILTEAIPLANHLKWSNTEEAVTRYYQAAKSANPDAVIYLQETWHSLNSGTGAEIPFDDGGDTPWRDRLEQDLPRWQAVVDEVNDQLDGDLTLLPVGQAMARLDDAIQAGTVPGLGDIAEVFADDIHPNAIGFYFISLVQFSVITRKNTIGLPQKLEGRWGKSYTLPSADLAIRLQEIAWAAAQGEGVPTAALPPEPAPLPDDPALPVLNSLPSQEQPADQVAEQPRAPRQPMAMNLMEIADWSPQSPFLDHFKTARPWIGHLPGRWGGVSHEDLAAAGYLDAHGWPTALPPELGSIGTVILTDLPPEAHSLAGRYVLRFEGKGIVEVSGRAKNVRYGSGEVSFDYTPGPGPVEIRLQRIARGDHIRNITVVREDQIAAFEAGEIFNPLWLDMLDGFEALRFMDWMDTNDSLQIGWEDRPNVTDFTWSMKGVPAEILLKLANTLGADPWFTMPHMADDSYMRNFAALVRDQLDEDLRAYVEYSNEVWNWQFDQAHWAEEQARALWGGEHLWMQFYGGRAAELAQIWSEVFGAEADQRLVRVISSQTGWLGLEDQVLTAPLWVASEPDRKPPATYFDAYAVTGYFGGILGLRDRAPILRAWLSDSRDRARATAQEKGLTGAEAEAFVAAHQYDVATAQAALELEDGLLSGDSSDTLSDLLGRVLPYHKEVADRHGLDLIVYEGGSHVVGIGPMVDDEELTGFFTHFNYTDAMAQLYARLLTGWADLGGVLFGVYADVATPGKWGSWGARRTLSDDNPRWRLLEAVK